MLRVWITDPVKLAAEQIARVPVRAVSMAFCLTKLSELRREFDEAM